MIIALSGWAGSGKDTVADYLINKYSYTRVSFADTLKDATSKTFQIPRDHFDNRDFKDSAIERYPVIPQDGISKLVCNELVQHFRTIDNKKAANIMVNKSTGSMEGFFSDGMKKLFHTPRSLLLIQGAMARSVNPNYWVYAGVNKIKAISGNVVITDLRFGNEASTLLENFSNSIKFIRVNRFDTTSNTDSSERDLDNYNFDAIIDNKGSLNYLYGQIDALFGD